MRTTLAIFCLLLLALAVLQAPFSGIPQTEPGMNSPAASAAAYSNIVVQAPYQADILFSQEPQFRESALFSWTILAFVLIMLISVCRSSIQWHQRKKEIKIRQYESELNLLKSQISPHFLFNSLNNIYSLCILEPQSAGVMVMNLSKMLRYMLYECQGERVQLARELSFLQEYVYMQQEKNHDNNMIEFIVSGYVGQQTIAPLLLINFLENSFKHSDLSINPNGFISIKITVEQQKLEFSCSNTYSKSLQQELGHPGGLGIKNTRKRLELLYPGRHQLSISKKQNQYRVQLSLWLKECPVQHTTKEATP
ncbi:sensor histidine kinase [Cesiribacter sp. SM1]|uniref:sensor histidine kinase n=1 Tax=Cesiribacter sp. SM1 TaxID=2861196 RepID=UPI001CD2550D|nr:sensor histidine kinase [Cesiribacter sp. SM1]